MIRKNIVNIPTDKQPKKKINNNKICIKISALFLNKIIEFNII